MRELVGGGVDGRNERVVFSSLSLKLNQLDEDSNKACAVPCCLLVFMLARFCGVCRNIEKFQTVSGYVSISNLLVKDKHSTPFWLLMRISSSSAQVATSRT